jgi:hypothetical protein
MAGQEKRTKKETLRKFSNTESGKEKIRWLLIYWSKLLIARAETSRDFGCCKNIFPSRSSTRRHFVFGHFYLENFLMGLKLTFTH